MRFPKTAPLILVFLSTASAIPAGDLDGIKARREPGELAERDLHAEIVVKDDEVRIVVETAPEPTSKADLSDPVKKQQLTYKTQLDAPQELIAISQPSTIPDIKSLKNYVYEETSGRGTWIYSLDMGVQYKDLAHEFPNVVPDDEHILTDNSELKSADPWVDFADDSHGTCMALKALGKTFGVAKNANLIVVKSVERVIRDYNQAFGLIVEDVRKHHAQRRGKVVVTTSRSFSPPNLPARNDKATLKRHLEALFQLDVPVVVTAGNRAEEVEKVDEVPPVLEDKDTLPLFVVGNVEPDGTLYKSSQRGEHVFLHAVGAPAYCLDKKGNVVRTGGTSVSAPQVAGEIANLLSRDEVPFDTSEGNLVKSLRAYLASDKGSWARKDGVRVLYNGVEEKDNPKTAASEESDQIVMQEL